MIWAVPVNLSEQSAQADGGDLEMFCDLAVWTALRYRSCLYLGRFVICYPRDAMLARVFATATCPSVRLSHAGIVPSRAKAGS